MTTRRRRWSKAQRQRLHDAHAGICHICGETIDLAIETMEVDHAVPLALGGADDWTNIRPAHVACHTTKTRRDVTSIAKAKRVNAKHFGIFRPPRRVVPGSRMSRWKKSLSGKVTRRDGGVSHA